VGGNIGEDDEGSGVVGENVGACGEGSGVERVGTIVTPGGSVDGKEGGARFTLVTEDNGGDGEKIGADSAPRTGGTKIAADKVGGP
jgi:hypothetical protein